MILCMLTLFLYSYKSRASIRGPDAETAFLPVLAFSLLDSETDCDCYTTSNNFVHGPLSLEWPVVESYFLLFLSGIFYPICYHFYVSFYIRGHRQGIVDATLLMPCCCCFRIYRISESILVYIWKLSDVKKFRFFFSGIWSSCPSNSCTLKYSELNSWSLPCTPYRLFLPIFLEVMLISMCWDTITGLLVKHDSALEHFEASVFLTSFWTSRSSFIISVKSLSMAAATTLFSCSATICASRQGLRLLRRNQNALMMSSPDVLVFPSKFRHGIPSIATIHHVSSYNLLKIRYNSLPTLFL